MRSLEAEALAVCTRSYWRNTLGLLQLSTSHSPLGERGGVVAHAVVEEGAAAIAHAHFIDIVSHVAALGAYHYDALAGGAEAHQVGYDEASLGELPHFLSVGVEEVEVVEAVALALEDEAEGSQGRKLRAWVGWTYLGLDSV